MRYFRGGGGGVNQRKNFRWKKNVIKFKMCVLIFFIIFVWNTSGYKKSSARYNKGTSVFIWSTRYSWQLLKQL